MKRKKSSPSRLRRRAKHDALLGPTRRLVRVLGSVELLECGHTAPVLPTTTRSGTGQIFRRCMGCRDGLEPIHIDIVTGSAPSSSVKGGA